MTDDTTQSGGSDDGSKPSNDAEKLKSVQDLVAEWDAGKEPDETAKASDDKDQAKVLDRLSAVEQTLLAERANKAMQDVFTELRDGLDLEIHDDEVEGWLNGQVRANPQLQDAFDNREESPKAWNEALAALKNDFHKIAETRYASRKDDSKVKSAARLAKDRSVATGDGDFGDLGSLSDADFQMRKAEIIRLAEAGQLT